MHTNHPLPINPEKRESLLLWGSRSQPLREKDWARRRRSDGSKRQRQWQSEREWEWEWERDWEWEGMRVRVTVCFLNLVYLSFFECVQWWTRGPKGNRVQWTQFPLNQTESNELGFWAFKPSPMNLVSWLTWTLWPPQLLAKQETRVQYTRFYNPKIDSSDLELLETKYVWNVS